MTSAYLDNIFIYSYYKDQDVKHVQPILQCLLEVRTVIRLEKIELHNNSVQSMASITFDKGDLSGF